VDWRRELPFLTTLADGLEEGILVIDAGGRIVLVSEPMAAIFGQTRAQLMELTPEQLVATIADSIDVQPELVREGRLLPSPENPLVGEEFEVMRPTRSVIRWVARWVNDPEPAQILVATDITAQVDLTSAYQRLAMTDGLTGLANRRHAEQTMRRETARSQRYGSHTALAILDVDHFKRINDSHGHATGDEVLISVARTLNAAIRESDFAARWGGEEFLLLMPNTDLAGGTACCERIRANIASKVSCGGKPVTVSIGLVIHQSGEAIDATLARADTKLYEAKHGGRNRLAA
jgi:diguanylate cyclase (GGDEF)-like protein/PAS domain S-box-containing protein